ncbi:acyl-CoA carboxylase subunit beta [Clostridiaceae bacterium HSG29]|nr:acyl-CoA carboxylase subunit beta [Clostridiaceae bacterium HSG29]
MAIDKLQDLFDRKAKIQSGGGEKAIEKQHAKGKNTARERMNMLFDESSFVELDMFVKHRGVNFGLDKKEAHADGVVAGYGKINGRLVYAYSQDFTVLGGSLGEMHANKIVKVLDNAMKMGAPVIGINDSGGARIQEAVDALSGYGKIFYKNTLASGVIPQISVIMGPCAGGAVYSPALTDFIFMVDKTSKMFITGPQVIQAVTGEIVSAEELGGGLTHNAKSGVAHYLTNSEEECFSEIRRLIDFLPSNNLEVAPTVPTNDDINRKNIELNDIIPANPNKPYEIKDVIKILADDGDFFEYQEKFAKNIVTGFIRINGKSIGVVANQPKILAGCLDINASDKAAKFVRTCDVFNVPILTLEDVPGFLPGTTQEFGGIIRHGAKLLYAYSEATVPLITVILRKAYGGSYLAMCSKELGADLVLAWPTAEVAVMGAKGAANIIFRRDIGDSENPEETRKQKIAEYEDEFATPYKAAERGFVDDVIEPSTTRARLVDAFDMLSSKTVNHPNKKHGNIPL